MTENGKPKYFTLMEELKEKIISGRIQPGEKLPSENQFTVQYSLSRHTVRKALSLLEQEGQPYFMARPISRNGGRAARW